MNVYDFDGTIYAGDCVVDFTLFCLMRQPGLIRALPHWARAAAIALRERRAHPGDWDKTVCKDRFYAYLPMIRDLPTAIDQFWSSRPHKLHQWYLQQKSPDDIIISASPRFLLEVLCKRLNVSLIASEVDPATGHCTGVNCYGAVKVACFTKNYPDTVIDAFYSDSLSDTPMARLAQRAFFVKKGVITDWDINKT